LRKKDQLPKKFALIAIESFFGEKNGKKIGILLNIVQKNVKKLM